MYIAFEAGHTGKPGAHDPGAQADVNRDSQVLYDEVEAFWTPQIATAAYVNAISRGHRAVILAHGTYEQRAAWAIENKVDVLVACHLNAGGKGHGLVLSNDGSDIGAQLATHIGESLQSAITQRVICSTPSAGYPRSKSLLERTARAKTVGIVYEPLFIDGPWASIMLSPQGTRTLALALVAGIHLWGACRTDKGKMYP
jgi:N-acetylmuramoyl-L-alanine amidase